MGAFYTTPFRREPVILDWLWNSRRIKPDPNLPEGRVPTLAEIRRAAKRGSGYEMLYRAGPDSLTIEIFTNKGPGIPYAAEWATLHIHGFTGELKENEPVPNYGFDNGDPQVVLKVMIRLARLCGPQVVSWEAENPQIITPDLTLQEALKAWEQTDS